MRPTAASSKATKAGPASSRASVFVREALGLETPRGRVAVFVPVVLALALVPLAWLERYLPQLSVCHRLLGPWCYSVGITRGVSSILKGHFALAWQYNPLAYLVLAVMLGIIVVDCTHIGSRKYK